MSLDSDTVLEWRMSLTWPHHVLSRRSFCVEIKSTDWRKHLTRMKSVNECNANNKRVLILSSFWLQEIENGHRISCVGDWKGTDSMKGVTAAFINTVCSGSALRAREKKNIYAVWLEYACQKINFTRKKNFSTIFTGRDLFEILREVYDVTGHSGTFISVVKKKPLHISSTRP